MRLRIPFSIIELIFGLSIIAATALFVVSKINAAGYGWTSPTVSGSDISCGAGKTPVTLRLRDYSNGNDISGFIEARNNVTSQYFSGNGNTLNIGCINIVGGYNAHASVSGFHEGWFGTSGFDPATLHDNGNTTDNLWLLPNSYGPSINIQSPSPNTWINYDPDWVVYVVPSPGHSAIEVFGFFAWNNTTGTAPCDLCIKSGSFVAGTHNVGTLGLPDGWYSFGAWARDALAGGTKGLTAWSEGRYDFGGTQFSNFGIDRANPTNIGRSHSPVSPNNTQSVTFNGWATDSLSGLDTIEMYYRINGGSWSAPQGRRDLNGETTQQNTSFVAGAWPAGTVIEYFTRAYDRAGNVADSSINSFTVQEANNRLNVNSTPVTGIAGFIGTQSGTSGTTNYCATTSATSGCTTVSSSSINTTIIAPSPVTVGGNNYVFVSWSGCDSVNNDVTVRTCTVSVSGGSTKTVTANYSAQNTLNVSSTPISGVCPITDAFGGSLGASCAQGGTPYTRTSISTMNSRIDAPDTFTSGGNTYRFRSASGCRNSSGADNTDRYCDVYVTGGGTQNVIFTYEPLNTLNVSSTPISGVCPITDAFGGSLGASCAQGGTPYTRTSISTMNSRIDAPDTFTSGGNTYRFRSASGCRNSSGADNTDRYCDVYVTGGGTQNVIFTYELLLPNLTVEAVYPTPLSDHVVGDILTINAQIRNNGDVNIPVGSSFLTRLRVRPPGGVFSPIGGDKPQSGLNVGATQTFIWLDVYTPSVAGLYEFEVCTDVPWETGGSIVEKTEGFVDNCEILQLTVEDSRPWLQTVGGIVGSKSQINGGWVPPGSCPPIANCNATHTVVAGSLIDNFRSAKSWLLRNYSGGPSLGLNYTKYSDLKRDFSADACTRTGNQLPAAKGRYQYNSSVNWDNNIANPFSGSCPNFGANYKNGAVVFINGSLTISASNAPFVFSPPVPTVFIVSKSINIASNVMTANGIFIADEGFNDVDGGGDTSSRLTVDGSILASLVGSKAMIFGRTYRDAAKGAAEIINFNPRYLWLMTQYLGTTKDSYSEVNP